MKNLLLAFICLLSLGQRALAETQQATFAAGCFWCVEGIYEQVPGVLSAVSGFAGGKSDSPTYQSHGDHTESVDVIFDPAVVSYEKLLRIFYKSHDATTSRGVAPDFGSSYRPALFYRNPEQLASIEKIKAEVQLTLKKPIQTEILPFTKFWPVEAYHQDFVRRNPNQTYVRNVSLPRIRETLAK